MRTLGKVLGLTMSLTLSAGPALATYSIAAVDQVTREVGGAVTSCVGEIAVDIVYGAVPGVGVVHAQAQVDPLSGPKKLAVELMQQGRAPSEVIARITQAGFDRAFASRQYGIVDVTGRSAGFTGTRAQDYKADRQAKFGAFVYSVQGNILTGRQVLDQTARGFEATGCDLAERLMRALEAGAENGHGDRRCTRNGIPSDSAFIQVDRPDDGTGAYLRLSVAGTAPKSAIVALRVMFDAWRRNHPCAAVTPDSPSLHLPLYNGGAAEPLF